MAGEDQHPSAVDARVLHDLELPEAGSGLAQRRPEGPVEEIRTGGVGDHAVVVLGCAHVTGADQHVPAVTVGVGEDHRIAPGLAAVLHVWALGR